PAVDAQELRRDERERHGEDEHLPPAPVEPAEGQHARVRDEQADRGDAESQAERPTQHGQRPLLEELRPGFGGELRQDAARVVLAQDGVTDDDPEWDQKEDGQVQQGRPGQPARPPKVLQRSNLLPTRGNADVYLYRVGLPVSSPDSYKAP